MTIPRQLTIRGFDDHLQQCIESLAKAENISLNKAALKLLRRGVGLTDETGVKYRIGNSLDHLAGVWSEDEEREFNQSLQEFEHIDESLWS